MDECLLLCLWSSLLLSQHVCLSGCSQSEDASAANVVVGVHPAAENAQFIASCCQSLFNTTLKKTLKFNLHENELKCYKTTDLK